MESLSYEELLTMDETYPGFNFVERFGKKTLVSTIMYNISRAFESSCNENALKIILEEDLFTKAGVVIAGAFIQDCMRGKNQNACKPEFYIRNANGIMRFLQLVPNTSFNYDVNIINVASEVFEKKVKERQICEIHKCLYNFATQTFRIDEEHKRMFRERWTVVTNNYPSFRGFITFYYGNSKRGDNIKYYINQLEPFVEYYVFHDDSGYRRITDTPVKWHFLPITEPVQNGTVCTFNTFNKKLNKMIGSLKANEYPGTKYFKIVKKIDANTIRCSRKISVCKQEYCLFSNYASNQHYHETCVYSDETQHLVLYVPKLTA